LITSNLRYIVDLSETELSELRSLTKTGKRSARTITRAYVLLMVHDGKTDSTIAEALKINVSTVERIREKFVGGGLEYALNDRPYPPKPRKLNGKEEAFLIATACSTPPEGRKGCNRGQR
jgi:DNA-binding CsgD family transcriptional regulator